MRRDARTRVLEIQRKTRIKAGVFELQVLKRSQLTFFPILKCFRSCFLTCCVFVETVRDMNWSGVISHPGGAEYRATTLDGDDECRCANDE